ncbi:MAG: hypothetical protein WCK49_00920 [Myxococcaceae bacterium]
MTTPEELLSNFQATLEEVQKAKKAILALSRDSEPAVRVLYRMALYLLHEEHDLEGASQLLSKLSACTVVCDARAEAQISFAMLLWTHEKYTDSIALLTRVASESSNKSHQALALDYLVTFMQENNSSKPAIAKINEQRILVLQELVQQESDKKLKSEYQQRLEAAENDRES